MSAKDTSSIVKQQAKWIPNLQKNNVTTPSLGTYHHHSNNNPRHFTLTPTMNNDSFKIMMASAKLCWSNAKPTLRVFEIVAENGWFPFKLKTSDQLNPDYFKLRATCVGIKSFLDEPRCGGIDASLRDLLRPQEMQEIASLINENPQLKKMKIQVNDSAEYKILREDARSILNIINDNFQLEFKVKLTWIYDILIWCSGDTSEAFAWLSTNLLQPYIVLDITMWFNDP